MVAVMTCSCCGAPTDESNEEYYSDCNPEHFVYWLDQQVSEGRGDERSCPIAAFCQWAMPKRGDLTEAYEVLMTELPTEQPLVFQAWNYGMYDNWEDLYDIYSLQLAVLGEGYTINPPTPERRA